MSTYFVFYSDIFIEIVNQWGSEP